MATFNVTRSERLYQQRGIIDARGLCQMSLQASFRGIFNLYLFISHLDFDRMTSVTRTPHRMSTAQQLASLLSTDRLKAVRSSSFSMNARDGLAVIVYQEEITLEVGHLLQKVLHELRVILAAITSCSCKQPGGSCNPTVGCANHRPDTSL